LRLGAPEQARARELLGGLPLAHAVGRLVPAEECFFAAASAGLLLGLRLADGSRVALKAMRPRPGLREAVRVQGHLHAGGFPCPRPLQGPVPFGRGVAVLHEWVEAPQRDLREATLRHRVATLLVELVRSAPWVDGLPPVFPGARTPFPPPHDPRFDLARPDGRWIDEAAARALAGLEAPAERLVGHSDWSAKHFGWEGDRVVAVHDWPDSVVADAEETIVGLAAATFPATWDLPVAPKVASAEESRAFVADYEEAAGRRLDHERVHAARTYAIAYCARCELSDLAGGEGDFQRELRQAAR
jgi:hypothetical protein